ncbi:MAG: 2-oxoacid:acceptor oxidoreductase family protein [Lentisphaeria bacterium]|nr:2-oxoacid:acceptor oxidoreductase family protein [Lentisphaeria bacterium]MBO5766203.1 2-oxoacid:acceptor oxidoreductase family protein [Lentisphaeria bacterium]MBO5899963.1 2-oxoacid:acceptor oxidoreductase family protein [Lentisphaeria bacterium]
MSSVTNIVVAGLGGQGVLKVTDILAEVVFRAGLDIKKSEVHGMSQRGGSVSSEVRFGDKIASPMVPAGEADYLVVIDSTQTEVVKGKLKENGIIIAPENVPVDKLENPRAINTMLLGALAAKLDFSDELWQDVLKKEFGPQLYELNARMFKLGFDSAK